MNILLCGKYYCAMLQSSAIVFYKPGMFADLATYT